MSIIIKLFEKEPASSDTDPSAEDIQVVLDILASAIEMYEEEDQADDAIYVQAVAGLVADGSLGAAKRWYANADTAVRDDMANVSTKAEADAFTRVLGVNWIDRYYNKLR